ncbi:hypothetical protein AB0448_19575 [Streptomyces achromogenes]|uniref:hypothetical protein n=1 Tax=Streptomyces achromogenes TaxID=67255 RepID=UPI00344C1DC2
MGSASRCGTQVLEGDGLGGLGGSAGDLIDDEVGDAWGWTEPGRRRRKRPCT